VGSVSSCAEITGTSAEKRVKENKADKIKVFIGDAYSLIGIFLQNRRMAKQFRRLGENVYARLAAGDANPMLQGEVKDQLNSIQSLEDNIAGRMGAIEQIRQKIKATSYRLPPPPAPAEPEAKPDLSVDQ
jgi:prefoldin subunit 5